VQEATALKLEQVLRETTFDHIQAAAPFDAIIVGSGAAGGLAAAQLCGAGLKTLVLDAGLTPPVWRRPLSRSLNAMVQVLANPRALRIVPPKLAWKARETLKLAGRYRQPIQSRCYAWEGLPNGFVDDLDNPYETPEDRPFNWIRARHLGGRMVIPAHGKQYLRHGQVDFAPPDQLSPSWPFAPGVLDPWYELVEQRLALHGQTNGSEWIPDSKISHLLSPDAAQARLMTNITDKWPHARPMLGRYSEPANSLESAAQTGKLSCRKGAVACRVMTGSDRRVEGVEFHDQRAGRKISVKAPIVFLCASTLETTRLLLNSRDQSFLKQAGSQDGALGRYVMDHVSVKAEGMMPDHGIADKDFNLGNCVYLPRFDLRSGPDSAQIRGYGMRLYQVPGPSGKSYFTAVSDAEMFPRKDNRVTLSRRTDRWGIPILHIACAHGAEEREIATAQIEAVREVSELLGVDLVTSEIQASVPGSAIHEVGGARMGECPETSVLDGDNQCWDAKGLYVTDGAAFPSIGLQNPTLTIMALTARACAHAVEA